MQEGKRRELEAKLDQLISRKEIDEGSFIDDFQTKTQTISSSIHEAASTYQLHRAAESEQLGRMLDDADGQLASWQQTQAEVDARYTALMQWREHHNFNTWLWAGCSLVLSMHASMCVGQRSGSVAPVSYISFLCSFCPPALPLLPINVGIREIQISLKRSRLMLHSSRIALFCE